MLHTHTGHLLKTYPQPFFCKQSEPQMVTLKAAANFLLLQNTDLSHATPQEEPPELDLPPLTITALHSEGYAK